MASPIDEWLACAFGATYGRADVRALKQQQESWSSVVTTPQKIVPIFMLFALLLIWHVRAIQGLGFGGDFFESLPFICFSSLYILGRYIILLYAYGKGLAD